MTTASLVESDGVFELAGTPTQWIWVHTCPLPTCSCRTAVVVATDVGRDALLERGATVWKAWKEGGDYGEEASRLTDVEVFSVDIDTGLTFSVTRDETLDLEKHPRLRSVVDRIDGRLLEAIGRQWYKGKSLAQPTSPLLESTAPIMLRGWHPGDMVAWENLIEDVRRDIYAVGVRHFEAIELYCPVPDCTCGEVLVDFEVLMPRGAPSPGLVSVSRSGVVELQPSKNGRDRLGHLWRAFTKRHPDYLDRFAKRYPSVKAIGARVTAETRPSVSAPVGRNRPCPCGSGRKYKICCELR